LIETNTIYNENCLETIKKIPNDFVDIVVTSPPYNMNLRIRKKQYCSRQIVKEFSTKYENFDDNLPIKDYYKLHKTILSDLLRISPLIFYVIQIVTGSKRGIFQLIGDFHKELKEIIVWDKTHGQPAMQKQVLNRQSELILVFDKNNGISRQFSNATFERGSLNDVWRIPRNISSLSCHKATFPEELVKKILLNFTKENDIVYDPFLGTGTTAVVAKKLKRQYIGSEISKQYFDFAKKNLYPLQIELPV
tara:strand:- start:36 stop:782 length:747 start_codon:yes stop_codon:yes gene_type:complete